MARRRSSGSRVIDFKKWSPMPALSASAATDGNKGGSQIAIASPSTILRIRGSWWCGLGIGKQAGDAGTVTLAIGIVSTDAATLGATALPDPQSEISYPWLWWDEVDLHSFITGDAEEVGVSVCERRVIDTKAMRRVQAGQSLALILEYSGIVGAQAIQTEVTTCRVLFGT